MPCVCSGPPILWVDPHPEHRRRDACEAEDILGDDPIRWTEHRVGEADVEAEGARICLANERASNGESLAVIANAVAGQHRMAPVWIDLEDHEVAEVEPSERLQAGEQVAGRARHTQVDVAGGTGAVKPDLEAQAALEGDRIPESDHRAGEESVVHQQLTPTIEVAEIFESLVERLLERRGGCVSWAVHGHLQVFLNQRAIAESSCEVTRPRRSACSIACSIRSGATWSLLQSRSVRRGVVTWTGPTQVLSAAGRSA